MIDPTVFSFFTKAAGRGTLFGTSAGVDPALVEAAGGATQIQGTSNPTLVRKLLGEQKDLAVIPHPSGDNAFYSGRDMQRASKGDLGKSIVAMPAGGVTKAPIGRALGATTPEVLAHELGHRQWGKTRAGKILQSVPALSVSRLTGAGGFAAGAAEQLWRDKRRSEGKDTTMLPVGLAVPAAMSVPLLASEAAASILGHKMLKRHGASPEMLRKGRKSLTKAYGTYLAGQGIQGLGGYGMGRLMAYDPTKRAPKKATKKKD